ncbi:uncharacterized protein isoform X2 [Leptinotarsa decemlineata]|uniref:uncharacterized protein isoform X2 n=1 Tax=Leptinotarsa decemlineata TaxID=7539 RepID=UPI003D306B42
MTMESLTSPEVSEANQEEEPPMAGPSCSKRTLDSDRTSTTPIAQGRKKKLKKDDNLDEILGMAQTITNAFGNRKAIPRNVNCTFAEYLYQELEMMPADKAEEKRRNILSFIIYEII